MRRSTPDLLRAVAVACLLGAAWGARGPFADGPSADPARGMAADGGGGWGAALAAGRSGPRASAVPVLRLETAPPDAIELGALAALADGRRLAAALPAPGAAVSARVAAPLAAGRRGALAIDLAGPADTVVAVFVEAEAGTVDTLAARLGADGTARLTAGVEPATPGWRGWTVRALSREARVGAWVEAARPTRVALWAAADGWEARYAARALEEAGRAVQVRVGLGRGSVVSTRGPAPLDSIDAFLLLPGARPTAAELAAIARRVREDGAGVLMVGAADARAATSLGLSPTARRAAVGPLRWTLPADLRPLPATDAATRGVIEAVDAPPGAVAGAYDAEHSPVLLLRPAGLGRAAWSGLLETWRWRQVAGETEAHTAYWAALADWLAAGTLVGARLSLSGDARVGVPVRLHRRDPLANVAGGGTAVRGPDGNEVATLAADTAAFVPDRAGDHELVGPDGRPLLGTRADSTAALAHPFGRLALLAYRSGGAALPRAELDAWLASRDAGPGPGSTAWTWALLFTAVVALLAAWTLGRLRGLP